MIGTKVTIVGAGNVGSQTASIIAEKNLADIVLVDIDEGIAKGKALDILEAAPLNASKASVIGTSTYEETADSEIVIVTAGVPRKPGMSRDDLIEINANILKSVIPEVTKYSPGCILIIVTNPLDAMVYLAKKLSDFPRSRIMGMAGILDSTRMRTFISDALKVAPSDTEAMVLGGHGDTMVPIVSRTKVSGKPLVDFMGEEEIAKIIERTRNGGAEIVNYLKKGSAYYATGASIYEMVEAILKDTKKTLPCCAQLAGEYGQEGLFIGVPVVLGKDGMEKIIEIPLTNEEQAMFDKTVSHVKSLYGKVDEL